MGKCCAYTYVHSGFYAPLSLWISASIKPSHKEVMGFHGPLEKLCANPERTEWEQGLSAPVPLGGEPPTTLSSMGMFPSLFTWWHSPGEHWDFPQLSRPGQRGLTSDKGLLEHWYLASEVFRKLHVIKVYTSIIHAFSFHVIFFCEQMYIHNQSDSTSIKRKAIVLINNN